MVSKSEKVTKVRKWKSLIRKTQKISKFDKKQNHIKFPVLGKKEKDSRGIPLISRSKAIIKVKNLKNE